MADEDEIDILGDFSFNSCFAQNNQGIPSCSDREDTVHPQWLLDSTATNWYDTQNIDKNRSKVGASRKLSGDSTAVKYSNEQCTEWTKEERQLLKKEMAKYGRNVKKISLSLITKSEAEILALIEAEHGIQLESDIDRQNVKPVPQELAVTGGLVNMNDVLSMVTTGAPTVHIPKISFSKKTIGHGTVSKNKHKIQSNISSEIIYEDDLIVGSETEVLLKKSFKQQKERAKVLKKMGNHRRKVSRNYDSRGRNRSKDGLKSPQGRQRKDSSLSDDTIKSAKMQIVLGSGKALPVSEKEQVIKIEKKKNSECESDIEVDIDSGTEESPVKPETPVAVPFRNFEPMPKRHRKILNLDGGGGYTIMHTESGDLYERGEEPRKERLQKKPQVHLIQCRVYNTEKPAPCKVQLHISALIQMEAHAHSSRGEVMGLLGGAWSAPALLLRLYRRARAASAPTHCDMDPVSQSSAGEWLRERDAAVCGWHHSHPAFPAHPSAQDLRSQQSLQAALDWRLPLVALITSQHWSTGRHASHYRCFRIEETEEETESPVGYQLSVRLVPDLTVHSLPALLSDLRDLLLHFTDRNHLSVDMPRDVCPLAGLTYLEKCISSIRHHMRSAGYADDDPLIEQLVQGIRDIFR